jgi:Transposase DDE domain
MWRFGSSARRIRRITPRLPGSGRRMRRRLPICSPRVLLLCAREGMGRFGKVAIDGTKVAANASKAANVTLRRVRQIAQEEVAAGLAADTDTDTDVDAPPPPDLRDRTKRRQQWARVRAELEAEQAARDTEAAAERQRAADYTAAVAIVEPVFGHLKDITGLRRFLTRGLTNITGEVHLTAATLNLRRLFTHIGHAATA